MTEATTNQVAANPWLIFPAQKNTIKIMGKKIKMKYAELKSMVFS